MLIWDSEHIGVVNMRQTFDFYPTPEWATKSLLNQVPEITMGVSFLEPCNGKGAISKVLDSHIINSDIQTNDIDIKQEADYHFDAVRKQVWQNFKPVNWVITNPPFSSAFPILDNAYTHAKIGVAFLLRLSFLEPTYDRQEFLDEHPPHKLIVLPRISFTGDGKTDSVTAAWFIWFTKERWRDSGIRVIRKS